MNLRLNWALYPAVAVMICGVFVVMLLTPVLQTALPHIDLNFITETPTDAGRSGGVSSILVSTFIVIFLTAVFVVPTGLATILLMTEFTRAKSRTTQFVQTLLDILSGVPSIVYGLFGYAFFVIQMKLGYSLLAGALTLSLMSLPYFVRVAEAGVRALPSALRVSGLALGLSRLSLLRRVILPAALPSFVAALFFSLSRALAETAALLFTSGYVDRMPESLFDGGRVLSVHVYDLSMNVPGGEGNAYKATLLLLIFVITIHLVFEFLLSILVKRLRGLQ